MVRLLIITDSDAFGDWVLVPATKVFVEAWKKFQEPAFAFHASQATERVFPREKAKRFTHAYDQTDTTKFLSVLRKIKGKPFVLFPNLWIIFFVAARNLDWSIEFAHQSDAIDAFRSGTVLQQKFDLVMCPPVADLFHFDKKEELGLQTLAELNSFLAWIDKSVGRLVNGPYKDTADAFDFKTVYGYLQAEKIPTLAFPPGIVVPAQIEVPWDKDHQDIIHLRAAGFTVDLTRVVMKLNLTYGKTGFSKHPVINKKIDLSEYQYELSKGFVLQPYVKEVTTNELKVVLPTASEKDSLIAAIKSPTVMTIITDEDEMSDTSLPNSYFKDRALRGRMREFIKHILQQLKSLSVETAPNHYIVLRNGPPNRSTAAFWVRLDIAWNRRLGAEARFLLNEVTGLSGAWTCNQNHVVAELEHLMKHPNEFDPKDQMYIEAQDFIFKSAKSVERYLSAQVSERPMQRLIRLFKSRLLHAGKC